MVNREFVLYQGEKFWIQTTGRYFQSGRKDSTERLLHRRVWSDANGSIPDGHHVHHIDGDWRNNAIDNLELVSSSEHASRHMLDRWSDEQDAKRMREALAIAVDNAKAWHSSPEGLEWHSKNGKAAWDNREKSKCVCIVCGSDFESYFANKAKFCSKSCTQKHYYQTRKTEANCAVCGSSFSFFKYRVQLCCSKKCAQQKRKDEGLQPDS